MVRKSWGLGPRVRQESRDLPLQDEAHRKGLKQESDGQGLWIGGCEAGAGARGPGQACS